MKDALAIKGLTLIELMVVIAITGLTLILSCGAALKLIQKNSAQAQASQLFHLLQFARTEAIKRNQTVFVCPSKDVIHCEQDWASGAMVYIEQGAQKALLRSTKNTKPVSHESNSGVIKYSADGRSLTRATIKIGVLPTQYHIVLYDSGRLRLETIG